MAPGRINIRCRKRSPWGTGRNPIVFSLTPAAGVHAGADLLFTPDIVGPSMDPSKTKKGAATNVAATKEEAKPINTDPSGSGVKGKALTKTQKGLVMDSCIKLVQINLHHSQSATALLHKRLKGGHIDIALIQEPWINRGKVLGLNNCGGRLFYDHTCCRPRSCVFVHNKHNAVLLAGYLNGDNVPIKLTYQRDNAKEELIIMSSYLPYEEEVPLSHEARGLTEKCCTSGQKLIIGCDANAHHILWGSSNCNKRGEELMEYILSKNLCILNTGNKSTFITQTRREVIDLTLCSENVQGKILNWHVSDDVTLSDHQLICFHVAGTQQLTLQEHRNPRRTDWDSYREDLGLLLRGKFSKFNSVLDTELAVDDVQRSILQAYHQNCKAITTSTPRRVPWWSKELSGFRKDCRRLFNRAKKTGEWSQYRVALTNFNKKIRDAKRASWRKFCGEIESIPTTARLMKVLAKDNSSQLNTVKKGDGVYTETGLETLTEMLSVHFPGSYVIEEASHIPTEALKSRRENWETAKKTITYNRIKWAINSLKPYKSPGIDGIIPVLLQQGSVIITPLLCKIYRACLAYGYIPNAWRMAKVVFIPKPGKSNYNEAKSYRPICLTSFLLKILEKLIDRHIRDEVLFSSPLSKYQHAYQQGKSTETALYDIVVQIDKAIINKEIALVTFLDIEGAFDRVATDTIVAALNKREVSPTITRWIRNLLESRTVRASVLGDTLAVQTNRGCPQGGVLSPLLWCLVVDELLGRIQALGLSCLGYADDIAIIVKGKFHDTISEIMGYALKIVEKWCTEVGLSVNPEKTHLVPFTRRRLGNASTLTFFGKPLKYSDEVKYLGIILDKNLNWKKHLQYCIDRSKRTFWTCKRAVGKSWGLSPSIVFWIYTRVVCPMITYGAIAWWSRVKWETSKTELTKLQRMACVAITGAMRTTPTASMELMLGLLPLHMQVETEAILSKQRLKITGQWRSICDFTRFKDLGKKVTDHPYMAMPTDRMPNTFVFDKPFKVLFPSRVQWKSIKTDCGGNNEVWFTDGSKMSTGTGAGAIGLAQKLRLSFSLGKLATVFQAEVFAILACARKCLEKGLKGKHLKIFSDSQAALKALEKQTIVSKIVWECHQTLVNLACENEVSLCWVPGHCGIKGNEIADLLAREGSETPFVGPEPVLGLPYEAVRRAVKEVYKHSNYCEWLRARGQRQAKELNQSHPSLRAKELLKLNRKEIKMAVELLTGHCRLKRHMHIVGVSNDPLCRGCSYAEETSTHILCECETYSALRFEYLGYHLLEPRALHSIPIRCLLKFISATGLLADTFTGD